MTMLLASTVYMASCTKEQTKPEKSTVNELDYSNESLFQQVKDEDLKITELKQKSNKNGLPDPTPAQIQAVAQWLETNNVMMQKYLQAWAVGSFKMLQNPVIRAKINVAATQYFHQTGVDFYAPFSEVINDTSALFVELKNSILDYGTLPADLNAINQCKTCYHEPTFQIKIRPKFFLYYKSHNLYPGIKLNKPLSVAIAFGRNPNDILAWEYQGNGQWKNKIIDSFELEQRAYILISPMIEFPDGSNLFINPSDGVGRCCRSNKIQNSKCLSPDGCSWIQGCRCETLSVAELNSIY
jgi:hypothetical protein